MQALKKTGTKIAIALMTVAIAAAAAAPAAIAQSRDGKDRHVKVINETRATLTNFYASRIEVTDWEEDILGDKVLRPGQSINMNIDDGTGACLFDFKAVFSDGDTVIRERINVCNITEYRYTEN